jgi:hypothetical protein
VVPVLSEGLHALTVERFFHLIYPTEVATFWMFAQFRRPSNPVEYLALYLLKHAPGHSGK